VRKGLERLGDRMKKKNEKPQQELPEWLKKWRGQQDPRWPTEVVINEYGILTYGLEGEPQDPPSNDDDKT
jgi:hypothetical protein